METQSTIEYRLQVEGNSKVVARSILIFIYFLEWCNIRSARVGKKVVSRSAHGDPRVVGIPTHVVNNHSTCSVSAE